MKFTLFASPLAKYGKGKVNDVPLSLGIKNIIGDCLALGYASHQFCAFFDF